MRYPIVIEPATETSIFGVMVPDLPGCFSAGDTVDEAFANAQEAAEGWIEVAIDGNEAIPEPSSIEKIMRNPDYQGWIFGYIDINPALLSGKVERINITIPAKILKRLDQKAKAANLTRSGYIAQMALK